MKAFDEKFPVNLPDDTETSEDYLCPSASWGDMTGLIPCNPEMNGAIESYNEVYRYLPVYHDNEFVDNIQKLDV